MKLNKILTLLMIVGLLVSSILVYKRFHVEMEYKNYEVDFYYTEMEKLAQQEKKSIDEYLELMKDTGIMNMFIREETIQSMKQSPKFDVETRMDGYDMIIESPDKELIQWIYRGYNDVKRADREVVLEDENTVRVVGESYELITAPVLTLGSYGQRNITTQVWEGSMLETVGLGYDREAIDRSRAHGYGVILAPTFNSDFQDPQKSIQRFFDVLDEDQLSPSHIFFTGTKVLGFDPSELKTKEEKPLSIEQLAKGLDDRNIALGFIESSSQGGYLETEGMQTLARSMEYEATGNYLTWDFIQTKFDYKIPFHHNGEEITNIFFRGITTRNIRIIALKPFVAEGRYVPDPKAYQKVLDDLAARLKPHGIKPGPLKTMSYLNPSPYLKIFVGIGIIASGLIILDNLFLTDRKWLYGLMLFGSLCTAAVYVKIGMLQGIADKGLALLGAISMPTIALFVLMSILKQKYSSRKIFAKGKSFIYSIGTVCLLLFVCLGGAWFEIAMLAHSKFLLGLDAFSGVKFSQMIPMLMAPIVFVAYYGYKRGYRSGEVGISAGDIHRFFTDHIRIWQVMLLGIAAMTLMVLMTRSGNTSGEPSLVEALLRNGLEFIFPARPRTKAIFVGIPALILLFYHAYQKRYEAVAWIFAFIGSIALVNTVNTFSHMKAPIYLSMVRTISEVIVGTIVGSILIIFEELVRKLFSKNTIKKGKEKINA
ncbi:MAG: DUF5693 family protein [Peptostreptococcaceae bacterium]|nr:DUF5693 family protein [Peptostreptococcaceae bacterium]